MSAIKRPTHEATEVPQRPPCECEVVALSDEMLQIARILGVDLRCSIHPDEARESCGGFRDLCGHWEAWLCPDCLANLTGYVRVG